MKRYALVLLSTFLVFVLGTSVALAAVSVPPSNPTVEPPGPFISEEQRHKNLQAGFAQENLQRRLDLCRERYSRSTNEVFDYKDLQRCNSEALKDYHDSMRAIYRPPQLMLPNGNSPGQGN